MKVNEALRISIVFVQLLTKKVSAVAILSLVLSGCAYDSFHYYDEPSASNRGNNAKVHRLPKNGIHRVKSGDTLFSIAFSYGLDYRKVANINGISPPYTIYPSQKIRLTGPAKSVVSSSKGGASTSSKVVTKNTTKKLNSSSSSKSNIKVPVKKVSAWHWPISGVVTKGFSNAGVSSKGIDIKGKNAEHVKAAADGVVVYAGNGLIGYGNLVIVKHNDVYLSAYAYNERILVKEKQSVRAGDSLAIIGGKGSERPLLHFEVRRDGRPIDPIKILPKK